VDKITGKTIAPITTGQIYWGAVPFVVIQCIMVGILIAFPGLVTSGLTKSMVDPTKIEIEIPSMDSEEEQREREAEPSDFGSEGGTDTNKPVPAQPDTGATDSKELEDLFKQQ
jgi:hypothetical protein